MPDIFNKNSIRCSEDLACHYEELAGEESCMFLDASQVTTSSDEDGFHLGEKESVLFAHAVASIITQMHFEARLFSFHKTRSSKNDWSKPDQPQRRSV